MPCLTASIKSSPRFGSSSSCCSTRLRVYSLEEEEAVARSREWFKHNPGTPIEDVAAELGFTMEQVRDYQDPA